jgi:microsomal epoxide hydrolase
MMLQLPRPEGRKIVPLHLDVPQALLDDLRDRLARTRWPEPETDASQGVALAVAQEVCAYWRQNYDWRRCEAMLNGFGQFRTVIDDLAIHFIHVRSPEPGAMPLLLTHGWPGSVVEFHKVIGPLTDPVRYGGRAADAFEVIVPSLPGYGFSDSRRGPAGGWNGSPRRGSR